MKRLYNFLVLIPALLFISPVYPEETLRAGSESEAKELEITARRLHLTVDRLKNARQALQEVTDLFMNSTQDNFNTLVLYLTWQKIHPSRAHETADEFIQKLRSEAISAKEPSVYQQETVHAVRLMRSITDSDFEKIQLFIRSWPSPPPGIAVPSDFLENLESQARKDTLWRLATSDPQKALTFLSDDPEKYDYTLSWQIARGFMSAGKKEEADRLIERAIRIFAEKPADKNTRQAKSNPEYVKRRLKEAARESGIDVLVRMAYRTNRNDIIDATELARMALEIARQLNSEIHSPRDREDYSIIRAYRELEGTVDYELFKNGFLLVEQLKKEESKPNPNPPLEIRTGPCKLSRGECLELRLITELSMEFFEEAMARAYSMENEELKFECLLMISANLTKADF